jgi:hypothetical protein
VAATGYVAAKVVDNADNAAVTGDAAAKVANTAEDAAAAGNAATKVVDTADVAATADVTATAEDGVTSAISVAAIPAVTVTNANTVDNANIVNSVWVRKSGTTKICKVTYPGATTTANGNTGTTTGEKKIDSKHITDSNSVDRAVDALIGVSIHIRGSCSEFAKISNPFYDPKKCSDMFNLPMKKMTPP